MRPFSRSRPKVRRLRQRNDLDGLVAALDYHDYEADRAGHRLDLGVTVRMEAVRALAESREEVAREGLIRALGDDSERVRMGAIQGLGGGEHENVAPALAAAVGSWPTPDGDASRAEALAVLLELEDPRTLELLAVTMVHRKDDRPLSDSEGESFRALLAVNGTSGTAGRVAWQLLPRLADERPEIRGRAETVLGWLESASVEPLIAALDRPQGRARAAAVLGRIRDNRALEPLTGMVFDYEAEVRRAVATALGQIKDPRAADALLRASRDPDYGVREAAITAFDSLGSAGIIMGMESLRGPMVGQLALERSAPSALPASATGHQGGLLPPAEEQVGEKGGPPAPGSLPPDSQRPRAEP